MTLASLMRSLGRPLALLAVWLVVAGTVVPFAVAADPAFCITFGDGSGDGSGDDGGLPATHCDACLVVAVVPVPVGPEPVREHVVREPAKPRLEAPRVVALRTGWIRGPPRGATSAPHPSRAQGGQAVPPPA